MKFLKKKYIFIFVAIIIVFSLIIFNLVKPADINTNQQGGIPLPEVTLENIDYLLDAHPIFKEFHKKAKINMQIDDVKYSITRGGIDRGFLDEADVTISLPSKYLTKINKIGLCATMREAYSNKDIATDMHKSKAKLTWRYKSMLKYRDCEGF